MNNNLIIAHRGESYDAPENTLPAIKLAWERNISTVEIDIQLTSDNKIVVIHDDRTTRISGVNKKVKKTTLVELRKLDVGVWKDAKYRGTLIPTLDEVLEALPSDKKLIIEIKCGTEIIQPLKKLLGEFKIHSAQISLISFNLAVCREAKRVFPDISVLLLGDLDYSLLSKLFKPSIRRIVKSAIKYNLDGVDLWAGKVLTSTYIDMIVNLNLLVYVWTVDEVKKARELFDCGVDGVTSNKAFWLSEKLNKI